ncbi:hypothetical protein GJ688_13825 [Heliobacillus mobilis]|uniref:Uncharacterized protein n=1 Tax=Heliobacterium mobile TaxID=28064 RepID=A0A6I3SM65_HELMO|nr:hypothetical protein [Heliobacterium mobile]MTV50050.1 hypothetical protein [Heliobacterium mobile]
MNLRNLWPEQFTFEKITTPKETLEQQASFLPKLTGDLVHAEVEEVGKYLANAKSITDPFKYEFLIKGKFIEDYSFRVFIITHDVLIYPIKILLDSGIYEELNGTDTSVWIKVNDEEEFFNILERTLRSNRIRRVISSIMSLSK